MLLIGKLIDQFINPYGYHAAEFVWDLGVAIWTIRHYIKWKKTTVV